jgi:DNA-binding transcriptional ArsR family regulator
MRRALLLLVRDTALPVGELVAALDASQPATSQHLAVLRNAGLVAAIAAGRRRLHLADHDALAEARRFFDEYWSTAVDRLAGTDGRTAAECQAAS